MKLTAHTVLLSLTFLFSFSIKAQNGMYKLAEKFYGQNPMLYNGKIHSLFPTQGIKGSPFLFNNSSSTDKSFIRAQLTIHGNTFNNQFINYDIYNQKLLFELYSQNDGKTVIEVPELLLDSFSINGTHFICTKLVNNKYKIYQKIGDSNLQFYYYWYTYLKFNSSINNSYYYFTKAEKYMFLKKHNHIFKFVNNRSFLKFFDKEKSHQLKKYLKTNKINVKKANDQQMLDLITYCNTL